jgi:anti-anti-sigma factor
MQGVSSARGAPLGDGITTTMCEDGFGGSVERAADAATLILQGEADLAARGRFQSLFDELLGTDTKRLVVDLPRLRYLESACLRIMLHAHTRAESEGRDLVVHGASGIVLRVLEVAGVADALIADDGERDG